MPKPAKPSLSQNEVEVLKLKLCQKLAWPYPGQQTILMKYHALFVIFEKAAKFLIVVCGALRV